MSALHKMSIGEIVAANGLAAELFEVLGVDYACHGSLTLREACAEAALDYNQVRRSLERLPVDRKERSLADTPVSRLILHLRAEKNPRIAELTAHAAAVLAERCGPCADHDEELGVLSVLLQRLGQTWRPHSSGEEHVLFPVIDHLDDCWARGRPQSMKLIGGTAHAIATAVTEHAALAGILREIETITLRLASRDPSCPRLQRAMHDLVHAVREHIHIENNVLFPRAAVLDDAVGQATNVVSK